MDTVSHYAVHSFGQSTSIQQFSTTCSINTPILLISKFQTTPDKNVEKK